MLTQPSQVPHQQQQQHQQQFDSNSPTKFQRIQMQQSAQKPMPPTIPVFPEGGESTNTNNVSVYIYIMKNKNFCSVKRMFPKIHLAICSSKWNRSNFGWANSTSANE